MEVWQSHARRLHIRVAYCLQECAHETCLFPASVGDSCVSFIWM
jgi:hypothetical protein